MKEDNSINLALIVYAAQGLQKDEKKEQCWLDNSTQSISTGGFPRILIEYVHLTDVPGHKSYTYRACGLEICPKKFPGYKKPCFIISRIDRGGKSFFYPLGCKILKD